MVLEGWGLGVEQGVVGCLEGEAWRPSKRLNQGAPGPKAEAPRTDMARHNDRGRSRGLAFVIEK